MPSQSLFSLKFPVTVGYDTTVTCNASERGNVSRNAQRGNILVIVPVENTGKNSGDPLGESWQLAHTEITSVHETRNTDGTYTICVRQNLAVYLPARFNAVIEHCRSLKEVVTAVNAVNDPFQLSGKFSFLDYALTQDRGIETRHLLVTNPRRVAMTASDVSRVKRAK